jgi:hypothetical protein
VTLVLLGLGAVVLVGVIVFALAVHNAPLRDEDEDIYGPTRRRLP